jgi:outer membrane protein OmpA-like peptidoglycan-associated protein
MVKKFHIAAFLLLALPVASCKTPELGSISSMLQQKPQATLGDSLTRGYGLLAQYEAAWIGDPAMGEHFRLKAQQGAAALPDNPETMKLSGPDGKEAAVAYSMLAQALAGDKSAAPERLAEAQVNFDCWMGRLQSGQKIGGFATAQWCRERFYAAMEGVETNGPKYFTVNFSSSEAIPDAGAFATIRQAAAAYNEHEGDDWRIRLTGHSDTKGNAEQKIMLAMRRALAVRNILAQNGVDPGQVTIATKKDKSSSTTARRVDIAVVPESMDRAGSGETDIEKMLPQYFGPEGPSF